MWSANQAFRTVTGDESLGRTIAASPWFLQRLFFKSSSRGTAETQVLVSLPSAFTQPLPRKSFKSDVSRLVPG